MDKLQFLVLICRNVRTSPQRRTVSPAALFSTAPTAANDDDFLDFSRDDVFLIKVFVL